MAYLADVFVLPKNRGQGLGKWLVQSILECPTLQGVRSISLATADAHELYQPIPFDTPSNPEAHMSLKRQMDWFCPDQMSPERGARP